jgi:adenylate cyclase
MLVAFRGQRFEACLEACAACRKLSERVGQAEELAGVYALYEERAREFRATPPPPDWDGVYVARTK